MHIIKVPFIGKFSTFLDINLPLNLKKNVFLYDSECVKNIVYIVTNYDLLEVLFKSFTLKTMLREMRKYLKWNIEVSLSTSISRGYEVRRFTKTWSILLDDYPLYAIVKN